MNAPAFPNDPLGQQDLSGVWLSTYKYRSTVRKSDFVSQHYVWLRQDGKEFTIESLPDVNDSYLSARFVAHKNVATGTWEDRTAQEGYYKGYVYYGAAQLIFDKDWKRLAGKWVGFGLKMDIKTGPWEIVYIGKTLPKKPMKRLRSI